MGASTTAMTTMAKKKADEARRVADGSGEAAPGARKKPEAAPEPEPEKTSSSNPVIRCFQGVLDIINGMAVQTTLYIAFVGIFQCLILTMRMREEFYLDKHVMDRIVENHFDSSHNTFESIRRTADVYEWGNNVLFPGLFGDAGPCHAVPGSRVTPKNCVDEVWPDGDGSFHMDGATHFGIADLVERMDQFDWTEGLTLRVSRVGAQTCQHTHQLGECYPELESGAAYNGASDSYGYNATHPGMPLTHPFTFHSREELGSAPSVASAAFPSLRSFDASGYVAVIIPFFSDTYLPEQSGTSDEVTDYRAHYVTPTNGRTPSYYCVRVSPNGQHLRQLCDPGANGDGTGQPTGAVRAAVEELWNDLKRGHFIDHRARVMTLTMQLRNNHLGVRYRITLMFEFTSLGAIFTSYDTETRMLDDWKSEYMGFYANIALGLVIFFSLMEGVEIASSGITAYFSDLWNVMDWANFLIYYFVYYRMQTVYAAIERAPYGPAAVASAVEAGSGSFDDSSLGSACAGSYMCREVGYFDDWEVMSLFRQMKVFFALCVCIQLLKVLKFLAALVPKTGLATAVLKACIVDLSFFGLSFIISMAAFSQMMFIQLGPVIEDYCDQIPAFVSLARALFGDFDIDEIMDNSSGYLNTILFLGYLFFAVFIMLSMFLAILAEGQMKVRENEEKQKEEGCYGDAGWTNEFGVLVAPQQLFARVCRAAPAEEKADAQAEGAGGEGDDDDDGFLEPPAAAPAPVAPAGASGAMNEIMSDVLAQMTEVSDSSKKEVQRVSKDMSMVVLQQIELMQEVRSLRAELKAGQPVIVAATAQPARGGAGSASGRNGAPRTLSEQPRAEPSIAV